MSVTPYKGLPKSAWWRHSVSNVGVDEIDPVVSAPFKIAVADKVATAGSCFAQHIARHLKKNGFSYYLAESAIRQIPAELALEYGYGVFSARYANIYTTRQLVQLFDRAFGRFEPKEPAWRNGEAWCDPFRPFIQPRGFQSLEELEADRRTHLAAVRRMLEDIDVFVFTLGLTECWESAEDGAVFGACPGTSGAGVFDASRHKFRNFRASEVTADLAAFIERLRSVNPKVRIVLTVSPVPLIATMENRSVVVSTGYSKAALRVAADEISTTFANVAYFPSYEMVTAPYNRGTFFADDWREVREDGVERVMRLFLKHFCDVDPDVSIPAATVDKPIAPTVSELVAQAVCDEVRIED